MVIEFINVRKETLFAGEWMKVAFLLGSLFSKQSKLKKISRQKYFCLFSSLKPVLISCCVP